MSKPPIPARTYGHWTAGFVLLLGVIAAIGVEWLNCEPAPVEVRP